MIGRDVDAMESGGGDVRRARASLDANESADEGDFRARRELHKNPDVVFAGYKNPHPTDHRIVLKVHTNGNTTPVQALREAVTNLRAEVSDIAQQFSDEINALRRE